MTLPTKILCAIVIVMAGGAYAYADVTAKDSDAVNFAPARGPASTESAADDQSALTVHPEIADNKTEGGSCQIDCHPVFEVNPKTTLAHLDLEKCK